jgi:nitrogen-specific signal transduction histidine kinase
MTSTENTNEIPEWFDAPLDQFVASLANEIRCDLESIKIAAEIMNSDQVLISKLPDGGEMNLVEVITVSAERSNALLTQVIKYSKIREQRSKE